MAGNARFHNKYHRRNHHSIPSDGYPDSGSDPIASKDDPFRGDFYTIGSLSATGNLTIGGDTFIQGSLTALGDTSIIDTYVTVTSALSVVNVGTGPAFTVKQTGVQDIAIFLDDANNTFKIKDGGKIELNDSTASGSYSLAEGSLTIAAGNQSHAEGLGSFAGNDNAHAEGDGTTASGNSSHSEGGATEASGNYSHAEGLNGIAFGNASHAEGNGTFASGNYSHAEGLYTSATNTYAHAEGNTTLASGSQAHAEGNATSAVGNSSHSQGSNTLAFGNYSHAEGQNTKALGNASHAAGRYVEAIHDRTFIWQGSTTTSANISTTRASQFVVSAAGGIFFPGNLGIGTDNNNNKLTVNGNISASDSVIAYALSARGADIIHSPANDGFNPTLRMGEVEFTNSNMVSSFSGAFISYNETTNVFGISSLFTPAMGIPAINIDRNSNLGIGTTDTTQRLTILGNISASGNAFVYGLSSRSADLIHSPANDGINPTMRMGEVEQTNTNVVSSFSGAFISYNETTNVFGISSLFTPAMGIPAINIDRNSNIGVGTADTSQRITVLGNISASGNAFVYNISSRGIDLLHSPANDGTNPVLRIGEVDNGTGNNGFSGAFISYNETTNVFGISSVFEPAVGIPAINIDRNSNLGIGLITPAERLTVLGNVSASGGLSAANGAFSSGITVLGNVSASGGLSVAGITATGNVSGSGGLSVTGITVTGNVSASGGLSATNGTFSSGITVTGNVSASGSAFIYGLSSRSLDLIHSPANDGVNPVFRIGEIDNTSPNVGFSGAFISYNETTNVFGISSVFEPAKAIPAINIDRNSNIGIGTADTTQRLTVAGNLSALSGAYTLGMPNIGFIPFVAKLENYDVLAATSNTTTVYTVPTNMRAMATGLYIVATNVVGTYGGAGTMPTLGIYAGSVSNANQMLGTLALATSPDYAVGKFQGTNTVGNNVRSTSTNTIVVNIDNTRSGTSYTTLNVTVYVFGYLII
jgi:hypothetical protein